VLQVAEVFGPTAQPFYLLKLPPPPFPVPSADELARGTKLYYPAEGDHAYVPVRMLKTDKRFKGTDASNLYDEELAEHEMEWSDDEEEQAAKRKLKADR
jgi:H/ACA ribonucleoprotein complex non-core subunit NAF1